jgi:hypothetical protein
VSSKKTERKPRTAAQQRKVIAAMHAGKRDDDLAELLAEARTDGWAAEAVQALQHRARAVRRG